MDTQIRRIIMRIILVITIFIASIPVWSKYSSNSYDLVAANYDNNSLSINIDTFKSLIVIDDASALSIIEPTNISIRNVSKSNESFKLVFLYDKSSTIDYKFLRVSLNNQIYNLVEQENYEDQDNIYFILNNINIDAYSDLNIDTRIWINSEARIISPDTKLTTNFIIK